MLRIRIPKKLPRNSVVVAMNLRNKSQFFHHKTEERGGARNEQQELLEEVDAEKEDFDDYEED